MQVLPESRRPLLPAALSIAVLGALGVAGCGGDGSGTEAGAGPVAAKADAGQFPETEDRTLDQLVGQEASESDLVVLPAGQVFHEGANRLGFGVFTLEREPVLSAEIALYAARPDEPARGPFPAAVEPLDVAAPFQSKQTATDPDAADVVYHANVPLPSKGEWRLMALIREDGELTYSALPSAVAGQFPRVPQAGDEAPTISTPTAEDVGGDLASIDTRQPPSSMHEHDFQEAVGKEPIVLLFATPALCQSRVCGPVVDIAEQVKAERGGDAVFIHMEIYDENVIDPQNLRPQVETYNLPTEPWLFVIDESGVIRTAIEGAFSARELNAALDEVAS